MEDATESVGIVPIFGEAPDAGGRTAAVWIAFP